MYTSFDSSPFYIITTMSQQTHKAVITVGPRKPLQIISLPTPTPKNNELLVRVEWTASTPLDLHQADGGLLVTPPQVLGDGCAGTIVSIGDSVEHFSVGDKVFGFTWRGDLEKAHQDFILAPENLFARIPQGMEMSSVVSVPNNFVTAFHCLRSDLGFELPWPKPEGYMPENADKPILVWGGSSSVGQYTIQMLKYYGYKQIIVAASKKHHELLKGLGATHLVDYRDANAVEQIRKTAEGHLSSVVDCIGSLEGSVKPIVELAEIDTIVAIMLPVIVVPADENQAPEYEMDVGGFGWKRGVKARGVRTHFYLDDEFLAKHLQTEIMPAMLISGAVTPNRVMIVEGETLLERAEKALDLLRRKVPSAERLVWRVSE